YACKALSIKRWIIVNAGSKQDNVKEDAQIEPSDRTDKENVTEHRTVVLEEPPRRTPPIEDRPADNEMEQQYAKIMGMEFNDILIPPSMTIVEDDTIMLNTGAFNGGVIKYRGVILQENLISFLRNKMPTNGWQFAGSSYAKNNSILAFLKPNKTCICYISTKGTWRDETLLQVIIVNTSANQNSDVIVK
ncbi:lipoprotein, partial [Candidatus Magnetoovum chiemensis]